MMGQMVLKLTVVLLFGLTGSLGGLDSGSVEETDPTKHNSKDIVSPDEIFFMSNETIGDNGDSTVPYAIYQDAELEDGYYNDTYAVKFSGSSTSFMDLDNTNGQFDAPEAFTWSFYIKPTNTSDNTSSVIMAYNGTDGLGGCELRQVGPSLLFKFRGYGIDSTTGSRQLTGVNVSTDIWTDHQIQLSESTWKYVSFVYSAYNEFARIQAIGNGNSEKTSENMYNYTGGGTHVFAYASGNIRFGNSFTGDMPFSGSIACMTFKGQSLIQSSFTGLEPQCDPASWVDTSNLGRVKEYVPPTTTSATSTSTTSGGLTVTGNTATSSLTTTEGPPTTGLTTTESSAQSIDPSLYLVDDSFKVIERCQHFTLKQSDAVYLSSGDIINTVWVQSHRDCTLQCLKFSDCVTYVTKPSYASGLMCYSGINTNDTKHELGAKFYAVYGIELSSNL